MAKKYNSVQGKLRKGGGKGLSGDALVGKVSQATIDDIKRMGMTKALALAGKNGKTSGGMAREFQEGVRRMYGAKRLEAAKAKYAPVKSKSADAARAGATKPVATKPASKPANEPAAKKNDSIGKKLATVGGTVAAIGLAAKGGPAGRKAATKLAPGFAKSRLGKALMGTTPKASPAMMAKIKAGKSIGESPVGKVAFGKKGSFGPTTKTLAKSKLGTPSEYALKAGQERARAQIKVSGPDAARAAATYPKTVKSGKSTKTFGEISKNVAAKTAPKKTTTVSKKKVTKAGIAASGAGQTKK